MLSRLSFASSAFFRHLAHVYAAEALCLLGRPAEALEHLKPVTETGCTAAAAAAAAATAATDVWSSPSAASAAAAAAAAASTTTTTTTTTAASQRPNAPAPATAAAAGGGAAASGGAAAGGGAGSLLSPKAADEARASLHANLAVVHALQGSLAQAERCARTAMGICPGSAVVLRTAVYVLVRQGNVAEALQVRFGCLRRVRNCWYIVFRVLRARSSRVFGLESRAVIFFLSAQVGAAPPHHALRVVWCCVVVCCCHEAAS